MITISCCNHINNVVIINAVDAQKTFHFFVKKKTFLSCGGRNEPSQRSPKRNNLSLIRDQFVSKKRSSLLFIYI